MKCCVCRLPAEYICKGESLCTRHYKEKVIAWLDKCPKADKWGACSNGHYVSVDDEVVFVCDGGSLRDACISGGG